MSRLASLVGVLLLASSTAASALGDRRESCGGVILTHVEGLAAAEAKRADDLVNADGLLWRIDAPRVAPSYLYGAIRSTDDSVLEIARRAARQIDAAKVVATELGGPLDSIEKANIGAKMLARALDRGHDTFDGVVVAADREPIEKLIADRGYPVELAHHLKLWLLAILTSIPSCETEREAQGLPEVDQFLAQTAVDRGIKVLGLETPEEQLDALSAIRPEEAAALLALAAREPGANEDVYATLLELYRQGRPAEILPITDVAGEMNAAERAAEDEFTRRLLGGRNAVMAERASPLIRAGGAFIAVGALHLSGKDGLVERFRAAGFKVTKVW